MPLSPAQLAAVDAVGLKLRQRELRHFKARARDILKAMESPIGTVVAEVRGDYAPVTMQVGHFARTTTFAFDDGRPAKLLAELTIADAWAHYRRAVRLSRSRFGAPFAREVALAAVVRVLRRTIPALTYVREAA